MKRFIAIILVLVTVLSLVACGGKETPDDTKPSRDDVSGTTTEIVDSTDDTETTPVDSEPEETDPIETEPATSLPAYKMAKIGADSRVSESKYGFSKTWLDVEDGEGKTFYALSWVFEEVEFIEDNYNYYGFKLKDAKTGEIIEENDECVVLRKYQSSVYDTDEFGKNGIFRDYPSKKMFAFILYSTYEIQFEDIEIWVEYDSIEYKLEFNAELSEITSAPKRASGYMFIKLENGYYAADDSSSGGGAGEDCNFDTFDFVAISDPLSSIGVEDPIIDSTKIQFYDKETGEYLPCVPGAELFYEEKVEFDSIDVHIGVKTTDEEILGTWYDRYLVLYNETLLVE